MTSQMGEAIEGYVETAKDLVHKWRDYASTVAANLDPGPYKADRAAADLGAGVSLAIETGARLTWEALDAIEILASALDRPYWLEPVEVSTQLEEAKLKVEEAFKSRSGDTLPAAAIRVDPSQLGPNERTFKVTANATGCPAGIYRGTVLASTPAGSEEVPVRLRVP
jgi:hypothetical protein